MGETGGKWPGRGRSRLIRALGGRFGTWAEKQETRGSGWPIQNEEWARSRGETRARQWPWANCRLPAGTRHRWELRSRRTGPSRRRAEALRSSRAERQSRGLPNRRPTSLDGWRSGWLPSGWTCRRRCWGGAWSWGGRRRPSQRGCRGGWCGRGGWCLGRRSCSPPWPCRCAAFQRMKTHRVGLHIAYARTIKRHKSHDREARTKEVCKVQPSRKTPRKTAVKTLNSRHRGIDFPSSPVLWKLWTLLLFSAGQFSSGWI